MKSIPIEIACPKCKGEGTVPLPHVLKVTLEDVKRHPETTTYAIAKRLPVRVEPTAIHNRLNALIQLGLVKREKSLRGKFFRYSAS